MPATTRDHVFPLSRAAGLETWRPSVRNALGQGLNVVPSCSQCNVLALIHPFVSMRHKRDFIQEKLKKSANIFNIKTGMTMSLMNLVMV
jgi:uncharacterized NAD-dependent epimerase/dehydratase family protein